MPTPERRSPEEDRAGDTFFYIFFGILIVLCVVASIFK